MEEDLGPRCSIEANVSNCINCNSTNLTVWGGEIVEGECSHCNDCKTTFGRCNYCDDCVKMESFFEVSGPPRREFLLATELDEILEKFPSCEYDGSTLKVPNEIEDEVSLEAKFKYWHTGLGTTYCCECNKLLLAYFGWGG